MVRTPEQQDQERCKHQNTHTIRQPPRQPCMSSVVPSSEPDQVEDSGAGSRASGNADNTSVECELEDAFRRVKCLGAARKPCDKVTANCPFQNVCGSDSGR